MMGHTFLEAGSKMRGFVSPGKLFATKPRFKIFLIGEGGSGEKEEIPHPQEKKCFPIF